MNEATHPLPTCFVVCGDAKALILDDRGGTECPRLHLRAVVEPADPEAEAGDFRAAAAFARDLAFDLERRILADCTARWVLVAPARTLARLRTVSAGFLDGAFAAEIEDDLVNLPLHDLARRLPRNLDIAA